MAHDVGLAADALTEEEEDFLPPHVIKRQEAYVNVRNHVLARWATHVVESRRLSAHDASA